MTGPGARPVPPADHPWRPGTLLAELSAADRTALLALGVHRAYAPGESLIAEGDRSTEAFLLTGGFVKVLGHSSDGRRVLLGIRAAGDIVGELAATDGGPRSATVAAATEAAARVIPGARFEGFLTEHPGAFRALHRSTSAKLRLATRHRIDVTGAPVLVRLARVLDRFADAYGTACAEGVRIEVPLSQSELAALIGAAEPSVHRALLYLRRERILSTSRLRQVILDRALLAALCADAGLPDLGRGGDGPLGII